MKMLHGENAVNNQVVKNHGKRYLMENTNNTNNALLRRKAKRPALCPVCATMFTGDAVIVPVVRGKLAYLHTGCEGKALTGKAFQPFNDNGGSTHTFGVVVHTTTTDRDARTAWAVYMRSCGFDTKTVANNIRAEAFIPAQSISKILRTLFKACKSVDINTHNFKSLEDALEYVKSVTSGNSHNR